MNETPVTPRPDSVEDAHLTYLDDLRESGTINMFGAATNLVDVFGLDLRTGREVLGYWMKSFSERHAA